MTWCEAFRKIAAAENLSISNVAAILKTSKTTAHRLLNGQITGKGIDRFRLIAADRLFNHFISSGCTNQEAAEKLKPLQEVFDMIADRFSISPEALRHFGLQYDPFDVNRLPDAEDLFLNKELTAVIARVRDAILYQRFVAVVGDVGSGKTLIKRLVADNLSDEGRAVIVYPEFFDMSEITVGNIASQILSSLSQPVPRDKTQRVVRIRQVLTEFQQDGVSVALVIDEAHRLSDSVISSLKNFWELTNGRHSRLIGVVLFAQPLLTETRLRDAAFREIRQRVQLIQMPPLTKSTADDYLRHRISAAGGNLEKLFTNDAVNRIVSHASTPLTLGNLAAAALMSAFFVDEKIVTPDLPFFRNLPHSGVLQIRRTR